jgi:alkylation response protein AidB-like acyl-CoA dehydrogenase
MFALVRTGISTKPQQGISFLLIDMNTPGITVRPIITLDGQHEFNEVTFDDVIVPIENRVGAEHEGWSVAKQLMRFARSNNTNSSLLRRAWRTVERAIVMQEDGLESELCRRIDMIRIDLDVFASLERNLLASGKLSGDNEMGSSLMKVTATELHQRITEVFIQVVGAYAIAMPHEIDRLPSTLLTGTQALRKYLATRAATIYSGTNEIHRNLIAAGLSRSLW